MLESLVLLNAFLGGYKSKPNMLPGVGLHALHSTQSSQLLGLRKRINQLSILAEQQKPISLSKRQDAIILGNILGDGHLQLSSNGQKARLRFTHGGSQQEYTKWLHKQLGFLCEGVMPPTNIDERGYSTCRAYTAYRPELRLYHDLIYLPTGKEKPKYRKTISNNLFDLLKDPVSLMVWYLDDGTLRRDSGACRLATQCFNLEEHQILQECLQRNFGIRSQVETWNYKGSKKHGLLIPSRNKQSKEFLDLFHDIVVQEIPSMKYKVER